MYIDAKGILSWEEFETKPFALSILFLTLFSLTPATADLGVMGERISTNAPNANELAFSNTIAPEVYSGISNMNAQNRETFLSASGVFDNTAFRTPIQSQMPRVFDTNTPVVFYGFGDMNILDKKPFQSAPGIFDFNDFKAPTQAEFPRVY